MSGKKVLSILICHMIERHGYLRKLLGILHKQFVDEIEIIINTKDVDIGLKRNQLMDAAKGEYIAYVDDDDLVSDDYVKLILEAAKSNSDCIGICGKMLRPGTEQYNFIHSRKYKGWFEKKGVYYRSPNHLNPIKRSIASSIKFNDKMNVGEDHDYSNRIYKRLATEYFIDKIIYFYINRK